MNANVRALCVLRALALVGASSACTRNGPTDGTSSNTQNGSPNGSPNGSHNSSNTQGANASIAGVSCGETSPTEGSSCEGHQIGHTCEWHGSIQCRCVQTPAGAKWSTCAVRAVPGPLPPPELAS